MQRHNGAFPQSQHLGARDRSTAIKASLVDIMSSRPELHSVTFSEGVDTHLFTPDRAATAHPGVWGERIPFIAFTKLIYRSVDEGLFTGM